MKFEEAGPHALHITKATLLYEGEEAIPGLLATLVRVICITCRVTRRAGSG